MTQLGNYVDGNFTDDGTAIYNTAHNARVEGFLWCLISYKKMYSIVSNDIYDGICNKVTLIE